MTEENQPQPRGYAGGWELEDASREHCFSLELAYHIGKLIDEAKLESIVDIGAGPGFYSAYLRQQGFWVYACDVQPHHELMLTHVMAMDLADAGFIADLTLSGIVEVPQVALCLEVGEHIPQEHEQQVLDNLAASASHKLIISWAVPNQTGFGHVNCQPNEYIIGQLFQRGWTYNLEQSIHLRQHCAGCDWFQNTIIVFDNEGTNK